MEFVIPLGEATDSREIDSNLSWERFCALIAKDMDVRMDELNIGYKFSMARVKDLLKLLKTPDHFSILWNDARKKIANLITKKSTTELKVELVNFDAEFKKKKKTTGNKKSVCILLLDHSCK